MTITISEAPGAPVVTVVGELDIYTAPALSEAISGLIRAGVYEVVADLTRVEFLDSTGLGVLVGALKTIQAHDGSLQLVVTEQRLFKLFSITGLTKVFVIHDSVETALANPTAGAEGGQPPPADHESVVPST